jgi:hypothetical protein
MKRLFLMFAGVAAILGSLNSAVAQAPPGSLGNPGIDFANTIELVDPPGIVLQDPPAEGPWSLGAYYSFGRKDYAAVTSNKIRTLEDFLGIRGLNPEVNAFAGVSTGGITLAGASLTFSYQAAKGLYLFGGPGIDGNITELRNISFGVHLGARWSINFSGL